MNEQKLELTVPDELVEAIVQRAIVILEAREREPREDASPWLNVEQASAYIAAPSRQRIYDLVSARRVPAAKDGTRTLIHRAVLDAYVAGADPWAVAGRLPGVGEGAWGDRSRRERRSGGSQVR